MHSVTNRFGGRQQVSAWQFMQAWRSARGNMVRSYQTNSSAMASAFANAQANLSLGLATLSAQGAKQRVTNAAQQQLSATQSKIDKLT